jgi:protein-disulfide isomerase
MQRRGVSSAALVASLVLAGPGSLAARDDLRRELEELKKGQQAIQQQLQEMRQILQDRGSAAGAPAPAGTPAPNVKDVPLSVKGRPSRGDGGARVTLVEFTDYQCPVCARHARETSPEILKEFVDTGRVRYVVMDLPLESIHTSAFKAAEASRCARDQGKYWEMHDRLFEQQRALEPWGAHAEALGLDLAAWQQCLDSGRHAAGIREDMAEAQRLGARGTPSFLLAVTDPDDPTRVKGLSLIPGSRPFVAFKGDLERALAAAGAR